MEQRNAFIRFNQAQIRREERRELLVIIAYIILAVVIVSATIYFTLHIENLILTKEGN